jgi:D-alanine-D-alanine ligase
MKPLRTLVVMHETLVPPESLEGYSEKEIDEWRTEFDVISHLKRAGHDVKPLGVLDTLSALRTEIAEWKPQIVFNLLEEFNGIVTYDQHVVAFLELLRQPYTGCNPRGLLLSRDKALSKQLLAYHRILTPQFVLLPRARRFHLPKRLRFPMFVKSATEDASLGIAQASVVEDAARLKERVGFIHEQTHSDALVEEYIEGRELYVGVIGNRRLTTLPVWEIVAGHCDAQGEVGQALPGEVRHHHQGRRGSVARGRRPAREALTAHLQGAAPVGLRAHGFPTAARRFHFRARG